MAIKELNPYLNFNGTAVQAIQLYERALGAKVEHVQRYGEVPGMSVEPQNKDRVMHAALRVGGGMLMLADAPPSMPVPSESNTHVTLHFEDTRELDKAFEALSAGGQVTMPVQDTFWGARFGMLTDKFGIRWMFNCDLKKG